MADRIQQWWRAAPQASRDLLLTNEHVAGIQVRLSTGLDTLFLRGATLRLYNPYPVNRIEEALRTIQGSTLVRNERVMEGRTIAYHWTGNGGAWWQFHRSDLWTATSTCTSSTKSSRGGSTRIGSGGRGKGREERLPRIKTVLIWARASKSDPAQGTVGSIFRQVLTMVRIPPPPIQRDWANVGNVIVLEEVCSAYKHTLADRLAYVRARGPLQDGALVFTTSPERITRHSSDLPLLPLSQIFSLNLHCDGSARWSSWESSRDRVEESLRLGKQLSNQPGL
ncbi:hypothetical protein IE53DRAFT_367205 [Violaceomyces palustris]|uniref:Uncharacterized protein n=1 Tax=Violaceomyces palustris TaxID=1673888 RepID=A0ACD0P377_9BASI|nr:hypothetical protein IE53DRAFT_367205 [Violaceomyces palustris]